MSEQTCESIPNDDKINIKEAWDVNFWCDELNLKADELKEIVRQVGPAVHDVRLHIAKRLILKWPLAY